MLRDRDAVEAPEGIVFRVYGYDHPPEAYICDVEYAREDAYRSMEARAVREGPRGRYYKFYEDQGLRFVKQHFPQYTLVHRALKESVVAVRRGIGEVRRADERLREIISVAEDPLIKSLQELLDLVQSQSWLKLDDFGVFGSLQHGFHHPLYSDIDLVVYGRRALRELRELLSEAYRRSPVLRNEFEEPLKPSKWRFHHYSFEEYVQHQRRKLIYGLFKPMSLERWIKVEFEPVRSWGEVVNEYELYSDVARGGMVAMVARVVDDQDSGFMPSIYLIEVEEVLEGPSEAFEAERVVSYVEEFRLQASRDDKIFVKGWLERVSGRRELVQVVLTRRERYYEQVLKLSKL
ncbi:MAG: nucleotidyltransferase domain-containing protein [Candidatus Nezhaarchaeota archaeon]|nr:nucleotidyltransferase domain-containing protein [Candidatus Nezhaarchaeota archaeon]